MHKKQTITAQTILVRIYFEDINLKYIVHWAKDLIEQGYYSPSLDLLTKKKSFHQEDMYRLFLKSVQELGLELKKEKSEILLEYSCFVAELFLTGQIAQDKALTKMMKVSELAEKDEEAKYVDFFILVVKLNLLQDDLSVKKVGKENRRALSDLLKDMFTKFYQKHKPGKTIEPLRFKASSSLRRMLKEDDLLFEDKFTIKRILKFRSYFIE